MFHVMLVLGPFILLAILVVFASIVLFGLLSVLVGVIGGVSAVFFIRSKAVKHLCLRAFCILCAVGSLCFLPILIVAAGSSLDFTVFFTLAILA